MRTRNQSYVFRSLILSNLLLLIVPLIIGASFYAGMIGTVSRETANANALMLGNYQYRIDGQLDELDKIASALSASRNIRRLASLSARSDGAEQRDILNAQDELSGYYATDSLIEDIYICIDGRCMITCANKYNADVMERIVVSQLHMDYEEFRRLLVSRRTEPFRISRLTPDGDPAVLFIRPFFTGGFSRPSGLIVIRLKTSGFLRLLKNEEIAGHGSVLLINALSEYCETGSAPFYGGSLSWENLSGQPRDLPMKLSGVNVSVTHIPSRIVGAEYVSVTETAYVYREVAGIRRGLMIYLALSLLIGGCTAYALARRNYSPYRRLRRLLLTRLQARGQQADTPRHEFILMEESLRSLLETERRAIDIQQEKEDAERSRLLARLLRGPVPDPDRILSRLRDLGVVFSRDTFLVLTVRVSEYETGGARKLSGDEDARQLIRTVIRQLGEGFLDEDLRSPVLTEADGFNVFIVNYDASETAVPERCRLAMAKVAAFARESLGVLLNIALSGEHPGTGSLPEAFSETRVALEYQSWIHYPDQVICFSDVNAESSPGETRSLSIIHQKQLTNCLEARDYDGAARVLDSLLSVNLSSLQSVQLMKIRSFALINLLLSTIDGIGTQTAESLYEDLKPVERLLSARTNEEFSDEIRLIFNLVIGILKQRDETRVPACIPEAEKYVHLHYQNPALSVSEIAEAVGVSVSYLSRIYKRWRGTGLLDYIHHVRMETARSLLGTMSVTRVAERVGYTDDRAFIRVYKKYYGTTPGRSAADWRDSDDSQ